MWYYVTSVYSVTYYVIRTHTRWGATGTRILFSVLSLSVGDADRLSPTSTHLPSHAPPLPLARRYVRRASSPSGDSRASASASATLASSSQEAPHCAGSSSNSHHSDCNNTNGLDDGEQPKKGSLTVWYWQTGMKQTNTQFLHYRLWLVLKSHQIIDSSN